MVTNHYQDENQDEADTSVALFVPNIVSLVLVCDSIGV